ncbi:MAG: hypothetical protein MZV64_43460 [Ignavibacteriales bacterium]|nr:hypothetical protein [Ignavibacteriales bacterium]
MHARDHAPQQVPAHVLGRQRHGAVRAGGLLRHELGAGRLPHARRRRGRPGLRRAVGRLPAEHRLRR